MNTYILHLKEISIFNNYSIASQRKRNFFPQSSSLFE